MRADDFNEYAVKALIDTAELGDPPEIPILVLQHSRCGVDVIDEEIYSYSLTHLVQVALNHSAECGS